MKEKTMDAVFMGLEPETLWKHFDKICKIPHCSRQEGPMAEYVLLVARQNNCPARRDKAGNVIVEKPAAQGRENSPGVVLQGHLDMVCEKNADMVHDFSRDPIRVRMMDGWIRASGTTLGADNGIGLAAALAVLEDRSLVHGPIELLFTADEETGLNGAGGLKPGSLKGRILLNLDSEEENAFFIGCAGGADSDISLKIKRAARAAGKRLTVALSGLRGGHSGLDIHTGRGNAVQLLARILFKMEVPFSLVSLEGGNKHNAIPREAFAKILVAPKDESRFKKALNRRFDAMHFEYRTVEKDMGLSVLPDGQTGMKPMDSASRDKFLSLLFALPHGVAAMSQEIPELVESSNNVAIVRCEAVQARIHTSSRSSIGSALEAVRAKVEAVTGLAGAKIVHLKGYPGWAPNLESALLKTMKEVHVKLTGKEPEIKAVHAGLECGIIGEKFPGMDMISFGPNLANPHSPDEKAEVVSVERFYRLLTATLEALV
jgi:dipeptidase D